MTQRNPEAEFENEAQREAETAAAFLSRERRQSKSLRAAREYIRLLERQRDVLEEHLEVREDLAAEVFTPPPVASEGEPTAGVIPIVLQSDEHYDSEFTEADTGGVNWQDPGRAEEKAETFVRRVRRLVEREALDNPVPRLVSPLLGDMIEGELHAKSERTSRMTPLEATRFAYRIKRRIFDEMLRWDVPEIVVPCVTGNHGRTTAKRTPGINFRYSHEGDLYLRLAEHYADEDRIRFYIPPTDFATIDVAPGYRLVITHGDVIRGGGGVGRLAPTLLNNLAKWRTSNPGELYALGHFHQFWDLGEILVNPSAVGYDPFASALGLPPGECPTGAQLFTTLHLGRMARATTCPVWVGD